jgi:hypothetical protein
MFHVAFSRKLHGIRLKTKHNLQKSTLIGFYYVFVIAVFIFYFENQLDVLIFSFIHLHLYYAVYQFF